MEYFLGKYPIKEYTDGREGRYLCSCAICGKGFIGDKRDVDCGEHKPISKSQQRRIFTQKEILCSDCKAKSADCAFGELRGGQSCFDRFYSIYGTEKK